MGIVVIGGIECRGSSGEELHGGGDGGQELGNARRGGGETDGQ